VERGVGGNDTTLHLIFQRDQEKRLLQQLRVLVMRGLQMPMLMTRRVRAAVEFFEGDWKRKIE
jgi:hypothetical protein